MLSLWNLGATFSCCLGGSIHHHWETFTLWPCAQGTCPHKQHPVSGAGWPWGQGTVRPSSCSKDAARAREAAGADTQGHGQTSSVLLCWAQRREEQRAARESVPGEWMSGEVNLLEPTRIPLIKIWVMAARSRFGEGEISGEQAANSLPRGCAGEEGVGIGGRRGVVSVYQVDSSRVAAEEATPGVCRPLENSFCGAFIYVNYLGHPKSACQHHSGSPTSQDPTKGRPHWPGGTTCSLGRLPGTRAQPQGPGIPNMPESQSSWRCVVHSTHWVQGQTGPNGEKQGTRTHMSPCPGWESPTTASPG